MKKLLIMRIITIALLLMSSLVFGQSKKSVQTKLDTLKANVAYDSLSTVQIMSDFKSAIFKELNNSDEYEYIKRLTDKYMEIKRQRWQAYIKQNNK